MSGEQLCPACSKGMNERSFGSAAASGQSAVPAPRAAAGRLQRPFSPGEDAFREAAGPARAGSRETAAPGAPGTARKPGAGRRWTSVSPLRWRQPSRARAPASGRHAVPHGPETQPLTAAGLPAKLFTGGRSRDTRPTYVTAARQNSNCPRRNFRELRAP